MEDALQYFMKYNRNSVIFRRWEDDSFYNEEGLYYARKEFNVEILNRMNISRKVVEMHEMQLA